MSRKKLQKYSEFGEWIYPESEGIYLLGLSDETKMLVGRIVYIEFNCDASYVKKGDCLATAEAEKLSFDIYMPFDGYLLSVNSTINTCIVWFNQLSEYNRKGWLFKIATEYHL